MMERSEVAKLSFDEIERHFDALAEQIGLMRDPGNWVPRADLEEKEARAVELERRILNQEELISHLKELIRSCSRPVMFAMEDNVDVLLGFLPVAQAKRLEQQLEKVKKANV